MNKRIIRKGSALLFTTVIMTAVSILAGGLTLYFMTASKMTSRNNEYFELKIEMTNCFYDEVEILISNSTISVDNEDINFRNALQNLNDSEEFNLILNSCYTNIKFEDGIYCFKLTKEHNSRVYEYERQVDGSTYEIHEEEAFRYYVVS